MNSVGNWIESNLKWSKISASPHYKAISKFAIFLKKSELLQFHGPIVTWNACWIMCCQFNASKPCQNLNRRFHSFMLTFRISVFPIDHNSNDIWRTVMGSSWEVQYQFRKLHLCTHLDFSAFKVNSNILILHFHKRYCKFIL